MVDCLKKAYVFLFTSCVCMIFPIASVPDPIEAAYHALMVGYVYYFHNKKILLCPPSLDKNFHQLSFNDYFINILKNELIQTCDFSIDTHYINDDWHFEPIFAVIGTEKIKNCLLKTVVGMIAYNSDQKKIIISFRGTKKLLDWVHNLNFKKQKLFFIYKNENIVVHAGYAQILERAKDSLTYVLYNIHNMHQIDEWTCIVTGHSLGGAVASLAVGYIKECLPGIKKIGLYTFGAPRVGCEFYNKWLEEQGIITYSFHKKYDLAPYNPSGRGLTFLGKIILLKPCLKELFMFDAHRMRNYLASLYDFYNISLEHRLTFVRMKSFSKKDYKQYTFNK